jgi:hypothetical protein
MNYAQLRAKVARDLHRSDLSGDIPDFINAARVRINERFGTDYPVLVLDTDTNESLTEHPNIWRYASLVEGYLFLHNGSAAETYDGRYIEASDRLNITAKPADAPLSIGLYDGT